MQENIKTAGEIANGLPIMSIFGKITPVNNAPIIKLQQTLQQETKPIVSKPKFYSPSTINERPLVAVYPEITDEAFADTMDKFRVYVANLNDYRREQNKIIKKHNAEVGELELNANEIKQKDIFIEENKSLYCTHYNTEVDAFFETHKIKLPKKLLHIFKYQSELIFRQILHDYSNQLKENTKVFQNLGIIERKPVKQLEINSWKIASFKRNGVKAIDVCKETIKNHRKHFIEAGILFDYTFCGHKRGVKCHVNREILTVFDLHTQKIVAVENQQVMERTAKGFGNNKDVTVTLLKNNKKKENVENNSLGLGTASPDILFSSYRNTNSQGEEKQAGAAAKIVKISENLRNLIETEFDFCNNLANGKYNNYNLLDVRIIYDESINGTLTREEFKEVIIQDFFKTTAARFSKLYKTKQPYFGSWLQAYRSWMNRKFFVNFNNNHLLHKNHMVDLLQEYRWRLNHAAKWFKAKDTLPLFPNQYFDFTRKTSKERGFEFTKNAFLRTKNSLDNRVKQENKMIIEAKKRKERLNYAKNFELVFNRFKNNRLTLNETLDYIKNNLPKNFSEKFTERLLEYSTKK